MQHQLLEDDDCVCFLVEAIAKKSQNITWSTTVDKKRVGHKRIRRVSLDQFYEIVTGEQDAFYKICMVLPEVIEKVVKESNDLKQLSKQIDKANEILNKPCEIAVGDAGYSSAVECEKLVQKGIEVIVPSQKQASHKKEEEKVDNPFDKSKFKYDKKNDYYICPEGKILKNNG